MAPPVPSFLAVNGAPDPRGPDPREPESQLPLESHMPGRSGTLAHIPPDLGKTGERGHNPTNLGFLFIPPEEAPPAPIPPGKSRKEGRVDKKYANYPEQGDREMSIADAVAVLGKADIQTVMPGGLMPTPNLEMSEEFRSMDEKNQTFLRVLEKSGRVTKAAEIAGLSRSGFNSRKDNNPVFAKLWAKALKYRAELFEDEAIRRAVAGVSKDVYYKGAVCGREKVYSDTLLSKLLEGNMPEKYRQNHKIELEAKVAVSTLVLPAITTADEWAAQNSGTIIDVEPEDEYATST